MKKCPYCAEEIQDEAIKCKHCGEFLDKLPKQKKPWIFRPGFLIIAFCCVGPLMMPLIWFNPNYGWIRKLIYSLIVVVITYLLILFITPFVKSIIEYYEPLLEYY